MNNDNKESMTIGIIGFLFIISFLIVLIIEGYIWLRYGTMGSYPLSGFTPDILKDWLYNQDDWIGLKKGILWLLKCDLSLFLFIIGFLLIIIQIKKEE